MSYDIIRVSHEARAEVSEDQWAEYQATALAHGKNLLLGELGDNQGLLYIALQDTSGGGFALALFEGTGGCGRSSWEHELRRQLDMDDRCF